MSLVEKPTEAPRFFDTGFLFAFWIHLCVLVAAFFWGASVPAQPYTRNPDDAFYAFEWLTSVTTAQMIHLSMLVVMCSVGSLATSFFFIALLRSNALALVYVSNLLMVVLALGQAAFAFYVSAYFFGAILVLVALGNIAFLVFAQSRITFSAAILESVGEILRRCPGILSASGVALVASVFFMCFWVLALGFTQRVLPGYPTLGFLLFSLFWTQQVLQNFLHLLVARVVVQHYEKQPELSAKSSLKFSVHSLGSICFGSLVVAVISTLRAMVHLADALVDHELISCLLRAFLAALEATVEYFNTYAWSMIALHPAPYLESATSAWELLRKSGISALTNDSLVSGVTLTLALASGGIASLIAFVLSGSLHHHTLVSGTHLYFAALGFAIGFVASLLVVQPIEAAATSLFVCIASNRSALKKVDATLYDEIEKAHPGVMINA